MSKRALRNKCNPTAQMISRKKLHKVHKHWVAIGMGALVTAAVGGYALPKATHASSINNKPVVAMHASSSAKQSAKAQQNSSSAGSITRMSTSSSANSSNTNIKKNRTNIIKPVLATTESSNVSASNKSALSASSTASIYVTTASNSNSTNLKSVQAVSSVASSQVKKLQSNSTKPLSFSAKPVSQKSQLGMNDLGNTLNNGILNITGPVTSLSNTEKNNITQIVFDGGSAPVNAKGLFSNMMNLRSVTGHGFDTSHTVNMSNMFSDDDNLSDISGLADWNVLNVHDTYPTHPLQPNNLLKQFFQGVAGLFARDGHLTDWSPVKNNWRFRAKTGDATGTIPSATNNTSSMFTGDPTIKNQLTGNYGISRDSPQTYVYSNGTYGFNPTNGTPVGPDTPPTPPANNDKKGTNPVPPDPIPLNLKVLAIDPKEGNKILSQKTYNNVKFKMTYNNMSTRTMRGYFENPSIDQMKANASNSITNLGPNKKYVTNGNWTPSFGINIPSEHQGGQTIYDYSHISVIGQPSIKLFYYLAFNDTVQFKNGSNVVASESYNNEVEGNSTTATLPTNLQSQYHEINPRQCHFAFNGTTHVINIAPNTVTDPIDYIFTGFRNANVGNGSIPGNPGSSVDITSNNDNGIPRGFKLQNANNNIIIGRNTPHLIPVVVDPGQIGSGQIIYTTLNGGNLVSPPQYISNNTLAKFGPVGSVRYVTSLIHVPNGYKVNDDYNYLLNTKVKIPAVGQKFTINVIVIPNYVDYSAPVKVIFQGKGNKPDYTVTKYIHLSGATRSKVSSNANIMPTADYKFNPSLSKNLVNGNISAQLNPTNYTWLGGGQPIIYYSLQAAGPITAHYYNQNGTYVGKGNFSGKIGNIADFETKVPAGYTINNNGHNTATFDTKSHMFKVNVIGNPVNYTDHVNVSRDGMPNTTANVKFSGRVGDTVNADPNVMPINNYRLDLPDSAYLTGNKISVLLDNNGFKWSNNNNRPMIHYALSLTLYARVHFVDQYGNHLNGQAALISGKYHQNVVLYSNGKIQNVKLPEGYSYDAQDPRNITAYRFSNDPNQNIVMYLKGNNSSEMLRYVNQHDTNVGDYNVNGNVGDTVNFNKYVPNGYVLNNNGVNSNVIKPNNKNFAIVHVIGKPVSYNADVDVKRQGMPDQWTTVKLSGRIGDTITKDANVLPTKGYSLDIPDSQNLANGKISAYLGLKNDYIWTANGHIPVIYYKPVNQTTPNVPQKSNDVQRIATIYVERVNTNNYGNRVAGSQLLTKFNVPVIGQIGANYSINPQKFIPSGYRSMSKPLNGTIIKDGLGLSQPSAVFYYNQINNQKVNNYKENYDAVPVINPNNHIGRSYIHNVDYIKPDQSAIYRGHLITRLASHYKYFHVVKNVMMYSGVLFNKQNRKGVILKRMHLTIPIHRVFRFHRSQAMVFEIRINHHDYFVTGNHHYVRNSYLQLHNFSHHDCIKVTRAAYVYSSKHYDISNRVSKARVGMTFRVHGVAYLGRKSHKQTRLYLGHGLWITANKNFVKLV